MDLGVKKMSLIKLFFYISFFVSIIYLIFSTYLTPVALNKSRHLLNNENFNSFLPTVKSQKFNDSFKGFTFFVEEKKIIKSLTFLFMILAIILKIFHLTRRQNIIIQF